MRAPLIVGVAHQNAPQYCLLDQHCQEKFKKEIFPHIDCNTLLLLEGNYEESYHKKWHPLYLYRRWEACKDVGTPIGYPTIGWRDERCREHDAYEQVANLCNDSDRYIVPSIVFPKNPPRAFRELLSAFLSSQLKYEVTGEVYDEERHLHYCSEALRWEARFDDTIIRSAREWGDNERHAMIICGGVHALTIHRRTGWPITYLADHPEGIHKLTLGLIATVLYPEKVLHISPIVRV